MKTTENGGNTLQAERELASRVLARRRLLQFVKRMDPKYLAGWVHEDICRRIERFSDDVVKGLSPRLMLLMPPRHGKSRLASIAFPAWHLGRNPDHEFIDAGYNVGLAMSFSRKTQALIADPRFPFETRLDPGNMSAESWGIQGQVGGYIAAGVGGGIVGKGAHVLLIDDPIKNAEEADSTVTREALWEWYTSTAYTRLAPGGGVLVIQTCWHDDDLAGRLQQAMAGNLDPDGVVIDPDVDMFEIVKYPAIAEEDEWMDPVTGDIERVATTRKILREDIVDAQRWVEVRAESVTQANAARFKDAEVRKIEYRPMTLLRVKGEPLHPERYDIRKLLRIKRALSNRFWSALYQQNPVPDDGAFFTRDQFKRAKLPDRHACNVYIAFDFAIATKQTNDFTVGMVGLQDDNDMLHMADMIRFKSGDALFIVEAIITLIKNWKTPGMRLGFEHGQIFLAIEALLKRRMQAERLFIPYETLVPVTDKQVRASPLQGRMQQGRVSYNEAAEWFGVVQNEMLRFPAGLKDDTVDAQAWMARLVERYTAPRKREPKKLKSWRTRIARTGRRSGTHMTA